jgi:hypothetical protein
VNIENHFCQVRREFTKPFFYQGAISDFGQGFKLRSLFGQFIGANGSADTFKSVGVSAEQR